MLLLKLALASRVLLDAHNCYPEGGLFPNRIERALRQGLPIAIEQDGGQPRLRSVQLFDLVTDLDVQLGDAELDRAKFGGQGSGGSAGTANSCKECGWQCSAAHYGAVPAQLQSSAGSG